MRESERQIKIYQKQLPKMRERVFAALSILMVAAVMAVSSTFAWLVLSQNPEVKGINTTIAANGNLEIALATGTEITEPNKSEVGDSGKDLVVKNTTWGNLVNLGDEAYGLEHIVLRPASLNKNALLDKPLYGAGYGNDGRVDTLVNNFAYAYYVGGEDFSASDVKYGVRTVSTVTYGSIGQNTALAEAVSATEEAILSAQGDLQTLAQHDALQDLVGLMGRYIQAQIDEKLGGGKEPIVQISTTEVDSIYYLMNELKGNIEQSADALAATYNLAMLRRAGAQYLSTNKFSGNYLLTATQADITTKLSAKNSSNEIIVQPSNLASLWQLRSDYNLLCSDIEVIGSYVGRDDVVYRNLDGSTFPAIETYVNHIADVGTTTVNGTAIGSLSASSIGSLTGGGSKPIVINKGIIQRMDKFTGTGLKSKELSVTIKVFGMGSTARGVATTSAAKPFTLPTEKDAAIEGESSFKGTDPIAGDTFGMALDFFVRTNAEDAHLILQGSPVYEEREETVKEKIGGTEYTLYTVTVDGEEKTVFLKQEEMDGQKQNVYYEYDRTLKAAGAIVGTPETITNATVLTEKVKYVVGYSGVNRVWDETESPLLDSTSTTQGAGSCYVFYPASPEDQEKSLKLLEHFRVAFISEDGELLGEAQMDTKNKAEQSGKVTVPLVASVTNDSIIAENGDIIYTIAPLTRNEATFITALVYLDGTSLTNDQVLAAGEIQGQLNIQFGTTADLNALDDPTLMEAKCTVSAEMEGDTTASIDSAASALNKKITVTVEGYEPDRVEAFFLREINSTQGIRQTKMTFNPTSNGKWEATHQFTTAGKYVLREVMLDGVTYELESPITFTVEGFTISNVYCEHNGKSFMTTEKSFDTSVSLTFATNDPTKMPSSVKGAFIHKDTGNRTTVYFTRGNGSTWSGDATLAASGVYNLQYLELDGEYTGLAESQYISIDLLLGLTTSVYTGDDNFALESGVARDLKMSLAITNDAGEPVGNLSDVWLQYSHNGSTLPENGVGAEMRWNGELKVYEGTFHIEKAGIYNYHFVSINGTDNTLYTYESAATITAISSNPPKYVSKSGFGEVFSLSADASFTIKMKNADSATIDAKVKNANGEEFYLRGTMKDVGNYEQEFTFVLPVIDGTQSGTYTLESIYLTNIYGGPNNALYDGSTANGPDEQTETKPKYTVENNYYLRWLEMPLSELTNDSETDESRAASITIVNNINVEFADTTTKVLGKDAGGNITSTFGTVHNLEALDLKITAGNDGKPLADYGLSVSSVELKYGYDKTCVETNNGVTTNSYGGYTVGSDWANIITASKTENVYNSISAVEGDSLLYRITANKTDLSVAGRYIAVSDLKITVTMSNGTSKTVTKALSTLNAPKYEVWTSAPTAKFTKTNPAAGTQFDVAKADASGTEKLSNSISADGLRVVCYFKATKSSCGCGGYTASSVTAQIENIGASFNTATLTVVSNDAADDVIFSFQPSSTTSEKAIGEASEHKILGENAKASQIVVTDADNHTYTFNLPEEKCLYITCTR